MMRLDKVTGYLGEILDLEAFSEDRSMNGLQVEASGERCTCRTGAPEDGGTLRLRWKQ